MPRNGSRQSARGGFTAAESSAVRTLPASASTDSATDSPRAIASNTSCLRTGTSYGASTPRRTLSPRISTTTIVMSLLITMLSSFFRDRTNIETFLGGPMESDSPHRPSPQWRRQGSGGNSNTLNIVCTAAWSSNSRAKEPVQIAKMERGRQVFHPKPPLQMECRPVGTPGRPCGSVALPVALPIALGWATAVGERTGPRRLPGGGKPAMPLKRARPLVGVEVVSIL